MSEAATRYNEERARALNTVLEKNKVIKQLEYKVDQQEKVIMDLQDTVNKQSNKLSEPKDSMELQKLWEVINTQDNQLAARLDIINDLKAQVYSNDGLIGRISELQESNKRKRQAMKNKDTQKYNQAKLIQSQAQTIRQFTEDYEKQAKTISEQAQDIADLKEEIYSLKNNRRY